MFYSTYHWRPIVFGRTSFYPPAMEYLAWQLRDFPDRDSLGLLRWLGVRTIVVHPRLWPEPERGRKLAALKTMRDEMRLAGVFPQLEGPDYERFGFGGEHVYTLDGDPTVPEDLCIPGDEITPQELDASRIERGPARMGHRSRSPHEVGDEPPNTRR